MRSLRFKFQRIRKGILYGIIIIDLMQIINN